MTAKQAYNNIASKHAHDRCIECLDFGEFFGFLFVPKDTPDDDMIGGAYDTVDKKTGALGGFNPVSDFGLLSAAKEVSLKELEI